MAVTSSTSTRAGVRDINSTHLTFAYEDLGGKITALLSSIAILNTTVSLIQVAVLSANASGATFSSLSGVTFTQTMPAISHFRA